MQRYSFSLLLLALMLLGSCSKTHRQYVVLDGFAQGSTYHIVYDLPETGNDDSLKARIGMIFDEGFDAINNSISGYDSLSILSKVNRNEKVSLDSIFLDMYYFSIDFYEKSNGALDVTSAPLYDLWGFGFTDRENVTQAKIDSVKQFTGVGMFSIAQDSSGSFLMKKDARAKLNFNSVAQGYTADYFAGKLDDEGIENYMIEIGGEIYCKGLNANGKKWRVGIDKPTDGNFIPGNELVSIIEISGKGLVTSGNYRKFYIEDGKKYSHTIDPTTGYPVQHNLLSATVVAENATIADAYATYFMTVGLEKAKEILAKTPGIEAQLIYGDQDSIMEFCTTGLERKKID